MARPRKARRALRRDHGDKRVGLMHAQALQTIMNHETPASQRNFKRAMRGFLDFYICSAHGLRKASAVRHVLNGNTAFEPMAWHGWKTIGEAQRYVDEANRIKLAKSGGDRMPNECQPSNPG